MVLVSLFITRTRARATLAPLSFTISHLLRFFLIIFFLPGCVDVNLQEAWLRASLEAACQRDPAPVHVIFFQHISLFLFEADEVNDYFNVDVEQRARLVSLCDEVRKATCQLTLIILFESAR